MQEPIAMMNAALETENKGFVFLPAQRPVFAPASDLSETDILVLERSCKLTRQIAREEVKNIQAKQADLFLCKAAVKEHSNALSASSDDTKDGLGSLPYYFAMNSLRYMTEAGGCTKCLIAMKWSRHSPQRSCTVSPDARSPSHNLPAQSQNLLSGMKNTIYIQ